MRVCFLLHQGKMHSGGQGVYLYNVTKEVAALGHEVHVLAGPPYPRGRRRRQHRPHPQLQPVRSPGQASTRSSSTAAIRASSSGRSTSTSS